MQYIAGRIYKAFCGEGFQPSRYCIIDSGEKKEVTHERLLKKLRGECTAYMKRELLHKQTPIDYVSDKLGMMMTILSVIKKPKVYEALPKEKIARQSIEDRGFIAVMDDKEEMFDLMNEVAPEHLEVNLENPTQYLSLIKNAGSVFLGKYASEPLGDYVAGPNHVLPTGGTARFSSPLGVYDFVKRTSFVQFSKDALEADVEAITTLAREEGLEAHARAVESRFGKEDF